MSSEAPKGKNRLHIRNRNREKYDLIALARVNPELKLYIKPNKAGMESIDFSNPIAVKALNKAILNYYYDINYWEFSDKNLCPPIPGRADYIHYIADLLREDNQGKVPMGADISVLDIGVGASCIYPILGVVEYGWKFIGSDIDPSSIESAQTIADTNQALKSKIECRLQSDPKRIFRGVIKAGERIDISICNPPFHASEEEAQRGSRRKIKNLTGQKVKRPKLNFSGNSKELIYEGGEFGFLQNMIKESKLFSNRILWFTSLVSKQSNLKGIYKLLKSTRARESRTIEMGTGNKSSRIVAWTFLSKEDRKLWRQNNWGNSSSK